MRTKESSFHLVICFEWIILCTLWTSTFLWFLSSSHPQHSHFIFFIHFCFLFCYVLHTQKSIQARWMPISRVIYIYICVCVYIAYLSIHLIYMTTNNKVAPSLTLLSLVTECTHRVSGWRFCQTSPRQPSWGACALCSAHWKRFKYKLINPLVGPVTGSKTTHHLNFNVYSVFLG